MRFRLLATATVLLLSACTLNTDYFGEYRGVNLLGNYDFNAVDTAGKTKWNLATSTDFMKWERIGDSTNPATDQARDGAAGTPTTGPDGKSPVYRLEIKNLVPNGDFEDATVTPEGSHALPAYWSAAAYGNGTPVTSGTYAVNFGASPSPTTIAGSIDGRSLGWRAGVTGDQLRLNLYDAATSTSPTAWSATKYRFHMDFINVADKSDLAIFLYTSAGTLPSNSTLADSSGDWTYQVAVVDKVVDTTSVNHVSHTFLTDTASTEGRILVLGPNGVTGLYSTVADNFRLVPDTENLSAQAVFPSLASGTNTLLPGTKTGMYQFSVQVRDDPTASTLNRFVAGAITIRLKANVKSGSGAPYLTVTRPTGGWPNWTTLTFSTGFDFVDSDSDLRGDPALVIELSPTYGAQGEVDAGSLLVSQPTLTFSP